MIIDKNKAIFEKIENKEGHVKKDVDADCIVEEEINENLSNNLNKFDVKEYEKLLELDTDLEEVETEDGEVKNVIAIYENANDGDQCLLGVECDDGTFGVLVYGYETNHFASVDSQEAMEDAVLNKNYKEFFPDATDIEVDSFDDYSDDEDVDVEPEQQILSDEDDVDDEFDATDDTIDYIEDGYFDDEKDSIKENFNEENSGDNVGDKVKVVLQPQAWAMKNNQMVKITPDLDGKVGTLLHFRVAEIGYEAVVKLDDGIVLYDVGFRPAFN